MSRPSCFYGPPHSFWHHLQGVKPWWWTRVLVGQVCGGHRGAAGKTMLNMRLCLPKVNQDSALMGWYWRNVCVLLGKQREAFERQKKKKWSKIGAHQVMKQYKKKVKPHMWGTSVHPVLHNYATRNGVSPGQSSSITPHMSCEGQPRYLYTMHESLGLSAPKSLYLDKSLSTSLKNLNVFARARLDPPQIFAPACRLGLLVIHLCHAVPGGCKGDAQPSSAMEEFPYLCTKTERKDVFQAQTKEQGFATWWQNLRVPWQELLEQEGREGPQWSLSSAPSLQGAQHTHKISPAAFKACSLLPFILSSAPLKHGFT